MEHALPTVPMPPPAEDAAQLCQTLCGLGYTESALQECLGDLAGDGELAGMAASGLIRLLYLGSTVEPALVEDRLSGLLERVGLLRRTSGGLEPLFLLRPLQGLYLASDLHLVRFEAVVGAGNASRTLARLTLRQPCERLLDLGTGCGVQALLATSHARRVWATDRNARAVAVARFNAGLNGLSGVCFAEGDLFEPVQGLVFERIVANPPFVLSPSCRVMFRDSGLEEDGICCAPNYSRV